MSAADSDLSQHDVAELTEYGPEELLGDFRSEAYDRVVTRWAEERPKDTERLENSDAFSWHNAYFEVERDIDGKAFTIVTGVELAPGTDEESERVELRDLAHEFVADWLTEYVESIQRAQAVSLFSRQELRTYWGVANWSKKDIKGLLDVSYGTVADYEERAKTDIKRANATLSLTYDQ